MRRNHENDTALAVGPFVIVNNGTTQLGMFLELAGINEYTVTDTNRTYLLDTTYNLTSTPNMLIFYSERWKSKIVLRPLVQSDVKWLTPNEPELDVNELADLAYADYTYLDTEDILYDNPTSGTSTAPLPSGGGSNTNGGTSNALP